MTKLQSEPTLIFIFGGSGDLTYRKLIPALYNLYLDNYLSKQISIIAIGRSTFSATSFRSHLKKGIQEFSRRKQEIDGEWKAFSQLIEYYKMDLESDKAYQSIAAKIKKKEAEWNTQATVVYYMSVAPQLAPVIAQKLYKAKLTTNPAKSRMVFEKPFGKNLQSAKELNKLLGKMFKEEQIYRIDHYLGKETVQNILALRFANALFEPIWTNHYIEHVQITAAETVSVESRGNYYEQAGALRDMVQNHMLQLLCMIAMEAPVSFDANEIRNKKVDVLHAIRKIHKTEVQEYAARGQYSEGWMKGEKVVGYTQEKDVKPDSATETFAAVKFYIDNWRWQNVPFYVRTGKYMHEKSTVLTIQFKPAPHYSFPVEAAETWRPNRLTISIQPEMDINLRFQAKQPGQKMMLSPVDMVFNYKDEYNGNEPEAYETLLYDVMEGDATLFMRADQVEAAWEVVMPIIEVWKERVPTDFPNYSPDSWGPEDAEALIARDGHNWITLTPKRKAK
jgi:glucose-6-phosphate 1-dehydrogenase